MKRLVVGFALVICFCGSMISNAQEQPARLPNRPTAQSGIIVGTITDVNNGTVPGATVALESPSLSDPRVIVSNDNGFFQFNNVEPGTYQITVSAPGFAEWNSPAINVKPIIGGVEISVRYVTRANERSLLRAKLNHAAVDLLGSVPVPQSDSDSPKPAAFREPLLAHSSTD